jgi:hypothetical protein
MLTDTLEDSSMSIGNEASQWTIEALCERLELQNPWEIQRETIAPLDSNGHKCVARVTCYANEEPEEFIILADGIHAFTLTEQEFEQLKGWDLR